MDTQIQIFQEKSQKAIDYLNDRLMRIRTGRANPALIEDLPVEAYESKMELKDLAVINAPESRLLVIQPWDQSIIPQIERAILSSNLGLTPATDKNVIRIQIPALTTERRQDLIKVVKGELEEARIKIRGFRREAIEEIEKSQKSGNISEDQEKRLKIDIQKEVDVKNETVEEIGTNKETELNEL
jgi:ribosome recycling factor